MKSMFLFNKNNDFQGLTDLKIIEHLKQTTTSHIQNDTLNKTRFVFDFC